MKQILKIIWRDDFSRLGLGATFFFGLITLVLVAIFWFKLPPQVPLLFSHPWGEEQLAEPIFLFIFPGGIILILITNLAMAIFFSKEKLLLRTLILANSLFSFLALYALIRILILTV